MDSKFKYVWPGKIGSHLLNGRTGGTDGLALFGYEVRANADYVSHAVVRHARSPLAALTEGRDRVHEL